MLGDVGDGPGTDGDDRQARLQLAEDLVDGVLVGVGLPVFAGLQDDRADLPAGVGEQPVHEILEVLVPAAHRGRIRTTSTGPGSCVRSSRTAGRVRRASGPTSTRSSSKRVKRAASGRACSLPRSAAMSAGS